MRIETGYSPRPWQQIVHEQIGKHRFSVPVIHRRAGKTVMAINILIDAAVRHQGGDGRFFYIAPFLKQAKQVAWDYLVKFTHPIPGARAVQSELAVTLPNGSQIKLYGADNPDAMRGLYMDGVVLDEVAQMKPQVWGEIVRPTLADREGWGVFIGTPHGMDMFYDLHSEAMTLDGWWSDIWDVNRTHVLSDDELGDARRTMSEAQFRQEFLCDFSASGDDSLITIDMVTAANKRVVPSEKHLVGFPKILGVDVARFGDDRSVIQKRWGPVAFEPQVFNGIDNMELVAHVAQTIHLWKPDACFIDAGHGQGVIDRLRQIGHDVVEVNFGGNATDQAQYENKRVEMWDSVRIWLEQTEAVLPDHVGLRRDLVIPTYSFDAIRNRKKLEPKAAVKSRAKASPDCGDALALTFAFPVQPRGHRVPDKQRPPRGQIVHTYDPFAEIGAA